MEEREGGREKSSERTQGSWWIRRKKRKLRRREGDRDRFGVGGGGVGRGREGEDGDNGVRVRVCADPRQDAAWDEKEAGKKGQPQQRRRG